MKILGIDYGLGKIGLAIADMDNKLAEPFGVIKVKREMQDVIRQINFICEKEEVEKIVIGLPESGGILRRVKQFKEGLAKMANLPVIYQDESLTSKDAVAKMLQAGEKRKGRRQKEDAVAAAIILQDYLNHQ